VPLYKISVAIDFAKYDQIQARTNSVKFWSRPTRSNFDRSRLDWIWSNFGCGRLSWIRPNFDRDRLIWIRPNFIL